MAVEMFRRQVNGTVSKPGPSTVLPDEHLVKYLEVADCGFGRLISEATFTKVEISQPLDAERGIIGM